MASDGRQQGPRPAATVVVTHTGAEGMEVFMVKRHRKSAFMPSVHVFPGGRVDPADGHFAASLPEAARRHVCAQFDGVTETAGAYCVAAIRETAEECGLLLARDHDGRRADAATAQAVFEALRGGAAFDEQLARHGLHPDVHALSVLAWWITPDFEPRRYDTRFFLASTPTGQRATFDAFETTEGRWIRPETALQCFRAGTLVLAPPTLATLEMLAEAGTPEAALAAVARPVRPIRPCVVQDGGTPVLVLPGDPLYPDPGPRVLPHRTRFRFGEEFDPAALRTQELKP